MPQARTLRLFGQTTQRDHSAVSRNPFLSQERALWVHTTRLKCAKSFKNKAKKPFAFNKSLQKWDKTKPILTCVTLELCSGSRRRKKAKKIA